MLAIPKERILLVDDEPQVLVALEDLLCDRFIVLKTQFPEDALNIIERERDVAVVITDQRMPRMTGDQLLAKLETFSHALRILVTGFADLSAVIRAVNDGKIFAYVTKPWNAEELKFKVQSAAEQFRLEKELAHERRLLLELMDNTPDGIYFKDEQLRFRRVNRAFAEMLGETDAQRLVGKRLTEVTSGTWDAMAEREVEAEETRVLASGEPIVDAVREYGQGSTVRWLAETKARISSPREGVAGIVGIARDVTRKIAAEAALRESQERQRSLEEQLTQSQKMDAIGRLAGGVAHDFNNLLAVIQSYADLLLRRFDETDPMRADMLEILGASQRAAGLTRQLLAFSRRQIAQPKILQLNGIVSDIEKLLRRVLGEDIALACVLSPTLGTTRADASHLEQILLNLVVNARDAMPNGGKLTLETANVRLDDEYAASHSGVTPGSYVMLAVTDTGTGMDAEVQRRIFEPFFTTKEVGKGTGLGLATVYGIVRQAGGHIWVYSELGRGTAFKVYLPRADAAESIPARSLAPPIAPDGRGTILVLEDDDAVRRVALRILRKSGYTLLEARLPSEAREIFAGRGAEIDLLLTDVVMPEISGPRFAQELSAAWPDLRVLFMSGYPGAAASHDALLAPDVLYVEKPFNAASLTEKVGAALKGTSAPSG